MLRRRAKHRYLSIMHVGTSKELVNAINKRCSELFGSIATEKAATRFVRSETNITIVRCRLEQLDIVLTSIAFVDPPAVTLDMSGSVKQLRRRLV